ncbi:MAG: CotH kinase family protein [Clostridia bacterium]|nr:CotH kinase family protein [Clostridia bacterium]
MNRLFIRAVSAALSVLTLICAAGCGATGDPRETDEPAASETSVSPDGTVRYSVSGPGGAVPGGAVDGIPGYISGEAVQSPGAGEGYTPVTAVPATGYRFAGWSDGVKDAVRTETPGNAPESVTALFEYDYLDMPVISVATETGRDVTSKEVYISCSVTAFDADGTALYESGDVSIRGRGNSTWNMEKKSYRLKLGKKENLLGVGKGKNKSWVLLANHCDHSMQRVAVVFRMASFLGGFDYVPGFRFVELYLNGEYRGVYLLTEQTQTGESRVNIDEGDYETNVGADFLIEKTAWDYEYGFTVKTEPYGIKSDLSPDENIRNAQIEWIDGKVTEACDALAAGNYETAKKLVDIDSLVDDYLLQEITKNFDVGFDSFYMFYTGGKLYFGPPWDFDLSLGNADLGFEDWRGLAAAVHPTSEQFDTSNRWFCNTMRHAWFRKLVVDRWNEIKDDVMTLPGIVSENEARYGRSFGRNFEKWDIFGKNLARTTKALTDLTSYGEHCSYLSDWLKNRIEWLDGVFNSKEFARGDLTGK